MTPRPTPVSPPECHSEPCNLRRAGDACFFRAQSLRVAFTTGDYSTAGVSRQMIFQTWFCIHACCAAKGPYQAFRFQPSLVDLRGDRGQANGSRALTTLPIRTNHQIRPSSWTGGRADGGERLRLTETYRGEVLSVRSALAPGGKPWYNANTDAGGGNRTHKRLPSREFESRASASSATPARNPSIRQNAAFVKSPGGSSR